MNITPKYLFFYIIIIIVSILFFRINKPHLLSIIGFIFGLIIVYILYIINKNKIVSNQDELEYKKNKIEPKLKYVDQFPDIINFIYDIKEFYYYNTQDFSNLINLLDIYMRLYDDIMIGMERCGDNIEILKDKKYEILNTLHSIIYSLEDSHVLINKHKKSLTILHKLLNKYLNKSINKCNNQNKNNININTKFINKHDLRTYNEYKNESTFQFY